MAGETFSESCEYPLVKRMGRSLDNVVSFDATAAPPSFGHNHVQNRKGGHFSLTKSQRLLAITGGENTVTEIHKSLARHLAAGFMIHGDEYGFPTAHFDNRRSGCINRCSIRNEAFECRQIDAKETPLARFAVNVDEAPMLFDDTVSGGQSHARALPTLLGGEERFEDALAGFGVHAYARVGNRQHRITARLDVGIKPAVRVVQVHHLGLDQ